ncbi:coiled-coil domain-containing protein 117 isoform X2 [Melanotaenia boesemani]|uniref:coiled-coil domain-containing protein 117 isoform X2 n=1 Tax=Melanotaenia boesemani TaxID=1250792 RepID=UPI001C040E45|nr:coiled-coil domain-containing protein 117 isoform X2 [Melanotaenia boesemani]
MIFQISPVIIIYPRASSNKFYDWISMHHPATSSNELGFLPAMYSFSGPTNVPEFDFGPPSASDHLQRATNSNNWETRCQRKHRRRVDDEGCCAKKRRLMSEAEADISGNSNTQHEWATENSCPALSAQQRAHAPSEPFSLPQTLSQPPSASTRPETESSCMEIEAAQRKLQEIEDRITLEDDDEDEDLDVEPVQRRPVLVISDSLKEGLQRGISDILPHMVAQSVSHSGMELVLWRPPEDPFSRRQKGPLQKQRKQQTLCRQPPTPCPSPNPHSPLSPSSPPAEAQSDSSSLYSLPATHSSGEEEMEM